MVNELFQEKPDDFVEFMIKYLKDHYGNRPSINQNERLELEYLRKECQDSPKKPKKDEDKEDSDEGHGSFDGSENESHNSEEDDVIDDLPDEEIKKLQKDNRTSVSSEAFGKFNVKTSFVPPKYEKSPEEREKLKKRLEQAFMFSALNPTELEIVVDAI
mmetsp:Transcript_14927/g.14514  ORF Transcript_14927/g.14514 Transcript_14927/m.14514 type:complete len:159 (+) Transcript_14927:74-550(+)